MMTTLVMTKPACASCGKIIELWILPEAESGPFYCGEECSNVSKGIVGEETEGHSAVLVAGAEVGSSSAGSGGQQLAGQPAETGRTGD